ncbi:MAG: SsrA-binding protein, partial [Oscillospiraceae bacterium]|nr:SsrA-binding protein [Oscillospiraceae bacterium]
YKQGRYFKADPDSDRRLLMHKREINRLGGRVKQEGLTLVPLSLYFRDSLVKVELGLCKGKKLYDKRDAAAEKSARREMDRKLKEANA